MAGMVGQGHGFDFENPYYKCVVGHTCANFKELPNKSILNEVKKAFDDSANTCSSLKKEENISIRLPNMGSTLNFVFNGVTIPSNCEASACVNCGNGKSKPEIQDIVEPTNVSMICDTKNGYDRDETGCNDYCDMKHGLKRVSGICTRLCQDGSIWKSPPVGFGKPAKGSSPKGCITCEEYWDVPGLVAKDLSNNCKTAEKCPYPKVKVKIKDRFTSKESEVCLKKCDPPLTMDEFGECVSDDVYSHCVPCTKQIEKWEKWTFTPETFIETGKCSKHVLFREATKVKKSVINAMKKVFRECEADGHAYDDGEGSPCQPLYDTEWTQNLKCLGPTKNIDSANWKVMVGPHLWDRSDEDEDSDD